MDRLAVGKLASFYWWPPACCREYLFHAAKRARPGMNLFKKGVKVIFTPYFFSRKRYGMSQLFAEVLAAPT